MDRRRPIVIQEARKCLNDGKPRLVRVSPTAGAEPVDGITGYTMMSHSGGTLDIFIELVQAKPHLLIFGRSPVARMLANLASALSYDVSSVGVEDGTFDPAKQKVTAETAIVVATQGEDDEGALERALQTEARYVAFVASAKKWQTVSQYLREKGFPENRIKMVKAPAGVKIGAVSPDEIAVSVLAQTIEARRAPKPSEVPDTAAIRPANATDPVCGMTVEVATARYHSDFQGQVFYFCCAQCKLLLIETP